MTAYIATKYRAVRSVRILTVTGKGTGAGTGAGRRTYSTGRLKGNVAQRAVAAINSTYIQELGERSASVP
eukprot:6193476-Pleurochrysis_carterae.AAC.1